MNKTLVFCSNIKKNLSSFPISHFYHDLQKTIFRGIFTSVFKKVFSFLFYFKRETLRYFILQSSFFNFFNSQVWVFFILNKITPRFSLLLLSISYCVGFIQDQSGSRQAGKKSFLRFVLQKGQHSKLNFSRIY